MKLLLTGAAMLLLHAVTAQEYLKQGDACFTQKNYPCAYDNYMKGYEAGLNATKDVLYYRIGFCLNAMKRAEEAKRWLWRSITEKNTLSPNWELASVYLNLKKYDSSAFYYKKAFTMATTAEQKRNISYWAGASYFNLKDYFQARMQLLECIKQDSAYAPPHLLLGRTYYMQKEYPLAEKAFDKALLYEKDSLDISDIYLKKGEVYYVQKKYKEAIPHYRKAGLYDLESSTPDAYLGDTYKNMNNRDSALYHYKKAIDLELFYIEDADSIRIGSIYVAMTQVQLTAKDTVKAVEYLPLAIKYQPLNSNISYYVDLLYPRKDVKTLEAILPAYAKALKANKQEETAAGLYTKLAKLYKETRQTQKEYTALKTALGLAPSSKLPLMAFVNQLLEEKKFKEATDSINRRLTVIGKEHLPDINGLKGELLFLQKDTAGAATVLREVLKTSEYNYNANFYLGLMAMQRKDTNTCRTYWNKINGYAFDKSIPATKTLPVHRLAGMDYFIKANNNPTHINAAAFYTSAANHFDYILSIDSSLPANRLYAGVANLQSRRIYTGKTHLIRAIDFYQKKKDSLAMIYRWLGIAEMRGETLPNFAKALEYYQKGVQASPMDSAVVNDLASAYYEKKDYVNAAETFGKLISIYKGSTSKAIGYYNRALCYYMNKQKAEAIADVNKSLEMNTHYADAKKLKAELEKPSQ